MARRTPSQLNMLLAVDKPVGCTSHDVVSQCRRALHERRVGHAGTLDPMASGVMVVGVGQATRLLGMLTLDTKSYVADISFGVETNTDDAEGEAVRMVPVAPELLGRPYMLRGVVAGGRHQGSDMGFPTANIQVPDGIQVPADGVYEGLVLVDDTVWPAAVNVGLPPTYADDAASAHLEANLIGYAGDLYGASVSLAFTRWLRPSRVFNSLDELIATVEGNIEDIRHNLGEQGVSIRDQR